MYNKVDNTHTTPVSFQVSGCCSYTRFRQARFPYTSLCRPSPQIESSYVSADKGTSSSLVAAATAVYPTDYDDIALGDESRHLLSTTIVRFVVARI